MMARRLYGFLLLACMIWALPLMADAQAGWKVYHAAAFDVSYPANFTVKPSLKSPLSAQRFASIFFVSPNGKVTFYATTNALEQAADIALKPTTETLVSTKTEKKDATAEDTGAEYELYRYTWQTIRAKDGRYTRALVIVSDARDNRKYDQAVLGIQYADDASYQQYRAAYLTFKNSLKSRRYHAGSFGVVLPPGFTARPSLHPGNTPGGPVISAFFTSPDKKAEFYAYYPWSMEDAVDYRLQPKTEALVSRTQKTENTKLFGKSLVTRQTIRAKDGSYTRQVLDMKQEDDAAVFYHATFGFKYRDQATYARYAEEYRIMQQSMELYHWD